MRSASALLAVSLGALPLVLISCRGNTEEIPASDRSQPAAAVQAIAEILGRHRITELRLTGGFLHAPCETAPVASDLVPQARCQSPLGSERFEELEREVRSPRSFSERLHVKALFNLLDRRPAFLDRALAALQEAADREPGNPFLLNDLGVAYALRAARDQQPLDLLEALAVFERASAMAPALSEARFNLALTLERFSLLTDARHEWERYVSSETDPAWAEEGKRHLAFLAEPTPAEQWEKDRGLLEEAALAGRSKVVLAIVRRHSQRARETVERELLRAWAEAFRSSRAAEAARALTVAREVSRALAEHRGERMPEAAVRAIDSAGQRELDSLAAGHLAFLEGYELYREARTREALPRLAAAGSLLARGHSPASLWARYFKACAIYQREDYAGSIAALDALEEEVQGRGFLSLEAHLAWMQGQNRHVTGRPLEALSLFRVAIGRSSAAGEAENGAALHTLVGVSLNALGRPQEAWKHFYASLRGVSEMRDPKRLFMVYAETADSSLRQRHPSLALRFQEEVVRSAAETRNPQFHADSLFWRGLMKEVGRGPGAGQRDLEAARRVGERLTDEMSRARFGADLAMVEGILATRRRPAWAITRLTDAIDFYDRVHLRVQSASLAYQARARAFRAIGRPHRAEEDLRAGLEIAEERMRSGEPVPVRWAYFEKPGGIFEEAIQLQLDEHQDAAAAFDLAERVRSLALPLSGANPAGAAVERPLTSAAILEALPPQTTLVHFALLQDRLCVWVLGPRGLALQETPVDRGALLEQIAAWRRRGWKEDRGATDLYDLLVRGWIASVPAGHLLALVPDPALARLPFAALRDGRTGRFLVEQVRLAVSPSASLFILASGRRPSGSGPLRALAVGNPAFDARELFLPSLPGAGEEARLVGKLYPGSTVLTEEEADRERFLAALPQTDLLHIATHTVLHTLRPEQTMLLLARSRKGGAGGLLARELSRLDLRHVRLVALSACQTGAKADIQGEEGISSLAQAFLLAGTPTVVASLWDVDDRASERLFHIFYQQLQAGRDPSRALRNAQIALLRSNDPDLRAPATWAAFQVLGATHDPQPERQDS